MKITFYLKGPLKKYGNGRGKIEIAIDQDKTTIRDLVNEFKIPASSISFIQVNGEKSNLDRILKGGEEVVANPRVAGG